MVDTDLVVDVGGWFGPSSTPGAARYRAVTPERVIDTRDPALVAVPGRLAGGTELAFQLAGHAGLPADASAAVLNLTVTNPAAAGFVRAYPCGAEANVSNINFDPGQTTANLAVTRLAPGGRVCFRSLVATDLVVDLAGWFAPAAAGSFEGLAPVRLFDTRSSELAPLASGPAPLPAFSELAVSLHGFRGLPADAVAAVVNVTVTEPEAAGYVKVYPCGTSPTVSNVNVVAGQTAANLAIATLPADGRLCFWSYVKTHLVVDLAGWFRPAS
jgi:hypothetical protein